MKRRTVTRVFAEGKHPPHSSGIVSKKLFDIDEAIRRLREAVHPMPKAALFALAEEGYTSVFEQLVACIISIRTLDEITTPTARALFQVARTPRQISEMTAAEIDKIIRSSTFHQPKARTIQGIAFEAVENHGGALPCDPAVLLNLHGVGPKCAHLALGIACGHAAISVDTHVHRVTNRWGYIQARTPEQSLAALERILPQKYWIEINRLLVPFGKHICTGRYPHCSTCPLLDMCRQVGVRQHR